MTAATLGARIAGVELGVPLRALRFVLAGCRVARRAGYAYDGGGTTGVVLVAFAVLSITEALAFDLLLVHAPVWRTCSDVVHAYAVIWMLALASALRTEPHVVDAVGATFRTAFLRSARISRADVTAVEDVAGRPPRGAVRLGIGSRLLRITLRAPAAVRDLIGERSVTVLYVAADDPAALRRALTS